MANKQISALQSGIEWLVCGVCFSLVLIWTEDWTIDFVTPDMWVMVLLCASCFWWRLQVEREARGLDLLQPVMIGTGAVLMLSAVVGYTRLSDPLQLRVTLIGVGLSALGCSLLRRLLARPTILLVGSGPVSMEILRHLASQVMGVLDNTQQSLSSSVPYLGNFACLGAVIQTYQPATIVVDLPHWEHLLSVNQLLDYKMRGGVAESAATAYERLFQKIYLPSFCMSNMLWAETQRAGRRVMALQAVYSNLIGLTLLLCLAPVLILLGVISRQASGGRGTIFDRVECAGFQGIPFQHRRFRVRNSRTGKRTGIGAFIEYLGIVNLPQIMNLNRGEMGLFGPRPMRKAFSDFMSEISPLHAHRLSVKPGIFGWEQLRAYSHPLPEEHERMAYDFYYVEHGSPIVDIKILVASLLGIRHGQWATS